MISRERGRQSLRVLLDRGLLTPDQERRYLATVEEGVSYRAMMIGELGTLVGELYLREEEAEHKVLHGLILDMKCLSVPEILVVEDDMLLEPWHRERFSESSALGRFSQEAAEPWHPSLLRRFRPNKVVKAYFAQNRQYKKLADTILKMAYGT